MLKSAPCASREAKLETIASDLAIVGGGLAGTCAAITAARAGIRVTLCQDRPVLGGNASSEVRLWCLGATSHMGNNNRWAREGGVANEILVDNLYRNPEGNPQLFDVLLLDKVTQEPNIRLLLNTAAYAIEKSDQHTITAVMAFCSQNSTAYRLEAPLFLDSSGDGIVGFLAGAAFRMGAESSDEFGELFAPTQEYGELLGHSIYFYSKDAGKPVRYVPPAFAIRNVPEGIPRYRQFNATEQGCRLWWIEYGGRLDTVHETEAIKWELWKVVYGVWDYIKNSGNFPDAENLTLEWVGAIPGKRESRRFEGDYMLRQQDLVEQRTQPDAVAFGGWSIDLHPADGVFSERSGCNQLHSQGIYQIPYRCLYSRNIRNLFLGGRLISASHVAFGSTRVMLTCAHGAQAAAMAAVMCRERACRPCDIAAEPLIGELQQRLLRVGQHIPLTPLCNSDNLAASARVTPSSTLVLQDLPAAANLSSRVQDALDNNTVEIAQMIPLAADNAPKVTFYVDATQACDIILQLRVSSKPHNHSPQCVLAEKKIRLTSGDNLPVVFDFDVAIAEPTYGFYCITLPPSVRVHMADWRVSGLLAVQHRWDQTNAEAVGCESMQIWTPGRRPHGESIAFTIDPPLSCFGIDNLGNGYLRPTCRPNAWIAALDDPEPSLTLQWDEVQTISRVELWFDVDYDHSMESLQWSHPESVAPYVIESCTIHDDSGRQVGRLTSNHQPLARWTFDTPISTTALAIRGLNAHGHSPVAVVDVRCF